MNGVLDHLRRFLTRPNGVFLALWIYVLAFAVLRLAGSPLIGTDDVQQALAAQSWAWGYEPRNPPLYTWLLMSAYSMFGVTQVAHVFIKYALILAEFIFAYLCGRRLFRTAGYAELSALSLMLVHLVGISSHVVFTHTVALGAALFMTWWALLRVLQERRSIDYALLGLACALGLLSKYNFILEIVPVFAVGLALRETRGAVLNWRMAITLAVGALVIAPHALWLIEARYNFTEYLNKSAGVGAHAGYFVSVGSGLIDLVVTLLVELLPFWLLSVLVFRPSLAQRLGAVRAEHQLLLWSMLLDLALVLIFLFAAGATDVKSRYLAPLILQVPLALFVWLEAHPATTRQLNIFAGAIAATVVLTYGGLIWQSFFYHEHCKRCWREMPVVQLAQQMREAGFTGGTIIANEWHLGGNLRLQFPDAAVLVPGFAETSAPRARGQCILTWDARLDGDAPPLNMVAMAQERLGIEPAGGPAYVHAPLLRSHHRLDSLAYWIVPNGDGNCHGIGPPLDASTVSGEASAP